ncbi:MAG: SDR family oxidoreductase [Nitrospira sp.]|nr:SDR family oxidoreductase [Nitrospira sp.]
MSSSKKVGIITGAANGIGRAVAIRLASRGVCVVLVDIDEEHLIEVADEICSIGGECVRIVGDVSEAETSARAVAAGSSLGSIRYLFNNAGIETVATIENLELVDFRRTLEVNLDGYFLMSKACIPYMKKFLCGVIVNNSSDAGLRGMRKSIAYGPSKAGVIQFTKALCLDLAGHNIRVNCICPGVIKTALCDRFNDDLGKLAGIEGSEAQANFVEKHVPLKRWGTPEEVAELVEFLFAEQSSYINGAIIPIDGGLTAGI